MHRFRLDDPRQLTAIGAGAVLIAACVPAAGIEDGPVLCPFRRLTGLPCPACGLTRSFVYTTHGHLAEAFHSHAFGPLLVLVIIGAALVLAVRAATRRPPLRLPTRVTYPVVIAIVAAWLGYAASRMAGIVG